MSRPKVSSPWLAGEDEALGVGLAEREGEQRLGQLLGGLRARGVGGGRETTVVAPTAITSTFGSSSRVLSGRTLSPLVVRKIATDAPGLTKPATRPVSERFTEMAMSPSGMVRVLLVAGGAELGR